MYNYNRNNKETKPHITLLECDGLGDKYGGKVRYYQGDTGVISIIDRPNKNLTPAEMLALFYKNKK